MIKSKGTLVTSIFIRMYGLFHSLCTNVNSRYANVCILDDGIFDKSFDMKGFITKEHIIAHTHLLMSNKTF